MSVRVRPPAPFLRLPEPRRLARLGFLAALLLALPAGVQAWGDRAHAAIGILAVERLSPGARDALAAITGDLADDTLAEACSWPDRYDSQDPDGAWSAPLHYVNIDPGAERYLRRRDCGDGACLPAAVVHYAGELQRENRGQESRWRAFAFLCHFTGDLHQPMHVAYADDRGGNDIELRLGNEKLNLHALWDLVLVDRAAGSQEELLERLRQRTSAPVPAGWSPGDVEAWVNETFTFTRYFAYPRSHTVDPAFMERSESVVLERLDRAASRLAAVLETVLGPASDAAAD